jgi:hypothetical protein
VLEDRILDKVLYLDRHSWMLIRASLLTPQDDSIFHPRTWHRAARLGQVSISGCGMGWK